MWRTLSAHRDAFMQQQICGTCRVSGQTPWCEILLGSGVVEVRHDEDYFAQYCYQCHRSEKKDAFTQYDQQPLKQTVHEDAHEVIIHCKAAPSTHFYSLFITFNAGN